jgi:phosphoglycolate phosphatase
MMENVANHLKNNFELDPEVGAVIVGFDQFISYPKMMKAASYLKNKDCIFIATNTDEQFPHEGGDIVIPGW